MKTYRIGEAAQATGLSAHTIRFYESKGLLPAARRSDSGYREYGDGDLRRLRLVHNARALGLPTEELGELLAGIHDSTCGEYAAGVLAVVEREQKRVDERIAELTRIRADLAAVAADASAASSSGQRFGECSCCLLIDDSAGEEFCQPSTVESRRRFSDETLEVLQCDINARPEAPTPDDLAPHLVGASVDGSMLSVRFRNAGEALVREFAAAECVCCGGLGWKVTQQGDEVVLTASGTPEQLRILATVWPQKRAVS